MARSRSSSSSGCCRYLSLSYYLKRPARLGLAVAAFVFVSFAVWDRQNLLREHDDELYKLNEELNSLKEQLQRLGQSVTSGEGIIQGDGKSSNAKFVASDPIDNERREKVKEAMIHAWNSYEKYAWGQDELQPQSMNGVNSFGGLGATLVDSLDTLYIMGLKDQFQKAREWVANSLDFNKNYEASVFETTIRVVGGLLSAYDLSGDSMFLEKARDIADRLLPAWNSPTGIPYNRINLAHGNPHNFGWAGVQSKGVPHGIFFVVLRCFTFCRLPGWLNVIGHHIPQILGTEKSLHLLLQNLKGSLVKIGTEEWMYPRVELVDDELIEENSIRLSKL